LFAHSSLLDYILVAVAGLAFVYEVYFYLRYMAAPLRAMKRTRQTEPSADKQDAGLHNFDQLDLFAEHVDGVSVLVCARNEEDNLKQYLHTLLEQDYPLFEVIVVNDGSEDDTQLILDDYVRRYPNMRTTFIPCEARVRSSKKLALTLAVKASRYDYLLLTDADCRPESKHWISSMMAGFSKPGTEVVLGYGAYFNEHFAVNDVIRYDTLFNGLQYLGMALAGHPYMGVGRNLMYRKDTFMQHNGFAGMLNERAGDDDLFVNKVASRRNTAVVLTPDSLTWSVPKQTYREWFQQKQRHLSVSPHYRWSTKLCLTLEPMMRAGLYLSLIAALIWGSAWTCIFILAAVLLRLGMQLLVLNRSARHLGTETFGLDVLWFDICLPILSAWILATMPKRGYQRW